MAIRNETSSRRIGHQLLQVDAMAKRIVFHEVERSFTTEVSTAPVRRIDTVPVRHKGAREPGSEDSHLDPGGTLL